MKNNLRPEVRVNKNGVPVTKHVREHRDVDYSLDKLGEKEQGIHKMTPALAEVALDFPDRAKEVAECLAARDLTPDSFDEEHLRMTLSNPSRAMNSGIL